MKKIFTPKDDKGWTYYIDWRFAWIPTYCQGTLVWLRRVWMTWPEKDGKPILWRDVVPADECESPQYNEQAYLSEYPYDPRKK